MLPNYGAARRFKNIPKNSNTLFVFPINPFTYEFELTEFQPEKLSHVLSQADIQSFLDGVQKIVKHYKTQLNKKGSFFWYCMSIGFISLGAIVNAILFPLTQAIACLIIGMILLLGGVLLFFVATAKYSKFQKRVQDQVRLATTKFIDKKAEFFSNKGYSWVIPKDFPKWIELRRADDIDLETHERMQGFRDALTKKALSNQITGLSSSNKDGLPVDLNSPKESASPHANNSPRSVKPQVTGDMENFGSITGIPGQSDSQELKRKGASKQATNNSMNQNYNHGMSQNSLRDENLRGSGIKDSPGRKNQGYRNSPRTGNNDTSFDYDASTQYHPNNSFDESSIARRANLDDSRARLK